MFNIYLHGKGKLVTPKTAKQKAIEKQEELIAQYNLNEFQTRDQQEELVARQAATMQDDFADIVQADINRAKRENFVGGSAGGNINRSIQMSQL